MENEGFSILTMVFLLALSMFGLGYVWANVSDEHFGKYIWEHSQIESAKGSNLIKLDSVDIDNDKITFTATGTDCIYKVNVERVLNVKNNKH